MTANDAEPPMASISARVCSRLPGSGSPSENESMDCPVADGAAADHDMEVGLREFEADRLADAPRSARHERGSLRHVIPLTVTSVESEFVNCCFMILPVVL